MNLKKMFVVIANFAVKIKSLFLVLSITTTFNTIAASTLNLNFSANITGQSCEVGFNAAFGQSFNKIELPRINLNELIPSVEIAKTPFAISLRNCAAGSQANLRFKSMMVSPDGLYIANNYPFGAKNVYLALRVKDISGDDVLVDVNGITSNAFNIDANGTATIPSSISYVARAQEKPSAGLMIGVLDVSMVYD